MIKPEKHIEAMNKIESLVLIRERTSKEIEDKLRNAGFTDEEVEDAISTALRVGLVSNVRYASAYIRGKTHKGWGRQKIIIRLHQAGISDEIIEQCSEDFASYEDEYKYAYEILQRKKNTSKNPRNAYIKRLMSRGYSFDLSKSVVADFLSSDKV